MRTFLLFGSVERQEVLHEKSRLTASEIFRILKEADGGLPVGDVIRRHGISDYLFQVEVEVRWIRCLGVQADQGVGSPAFGVQADRGQSNA